MARTFRIDDMLRIGLRGVLPPAEEKSAQTAEALQKGIAGHFVRGVTEEMKVWR